MIRSVADSTAAKPATSAAGKASDATGGFAGELAKAKATTETVSAKHAAPKGERTQAVLGHNYAEIVAGPRNGMFLNTSQNKRAGEAFLIVQRHGRTFHVYGSGRDRAVVEVHPHHAAKAAPAGTTPAASASKG